MLRKLLPSNHEDIPSVYNGIGRVHSERNELNLALENYEIAYKIRRERLPSNHSHIAASLHNIASILKEKKDFDQALDYYQQALTIEENNHPDDHLQKAIIIQNIGNIFIEKANLDTAFKHLSDAFSMFQRILPEQHPNISTCLGDIGFIYENKGDLGKALEYYHTEFDMDERCLPSDHPHLSRDLKKIVVTYKKNKQIDKAHEFCRKKLDDLKKISGNNNSRIPKTLMTMANLLEESNPKEVLLYYKEALSNLEKSTQIDHRTIAKCLASIGRVCRMYKQFDIALQYLLNALDVYKLVLSSFDHIDIASVYRNIALCYQKTNKPLEALRYFNDSFLIYRTIYGGDHEDAKLLENDIAKLDSEQQMTTTSSTEPTENENVKDEQCIAITFVSDSPQSFVAQLPSSVIDAISMPTLDENNIKSKSKTSVKSKHCPKCEIL